MANDDLVTGLSMIQRGVHTGLVDAGKGEYNTRVLIHALGGLSSGDAALDDTLQIKQKFIDRAVERYVRAKDGNMLSYGKPKLPEEVLLDDLYPHINKSENGRLTREEKNQMSHNITAVLKEIAEGRAGFVEGQRSGSRTPASTRAR